MRFFTGVHGLLYGSNDDYSQLAQARVVYPWGKDKIEIGKPDRYWTEI
jgi:hypothetical protein